MKDGQKTVLTEMLGPELTDMRSGDLRKALRRGDKFVERVVEDAAEYTGIAVANVINLRSWHDETGLGDPHHPLLSEPDYYGFRYLSRDDYDQHIQDHLDDQAA